MTSPKTNTPQQQIYGYTAFNIEKDERPYKCFEMLLIFVSYFLLIICPLALFCCWVVIKEYERAITFRFGRLRKIEPRGPGLIFILPCVDTYNVVDLRTLYFDVPPQEILTKDSVTIAVDAVVYYRTFDATMAITNVQDYKKASHLLAASILRNTLGTKNMVDILTQRESLSYAMQKQLDEATDPWGVKIERVEMKDVRLPHNMQRAMAAEAEATREAKAKSNCCRR
uniref:Band 7 domain-containing protein n=1 Tax=Strigamia maritima TaxID=126957 RepID=T1ITZ1_STRMM